MNKQIKLNREYWGRIINMCQGTALEGREWECVKINGGPWLIDTHPCFTGTLDNYELAIAVVEDRAVFRDSQLYCKNTGDKAFAGRVGADPDWTVWTWQKPEPKRTFLLNGVALPCPVKNHEGDWYIQINGKTYWFKLEDEANKVQNTISNLLDSARDKE